MKLYTEIIESKADDQYDLTADEMSKFIKKTKGKLPKDVEIALQYLNNYQIYDSATVDRILKATKSESEEIASEHKKLTADVVQDMKKILKALRENIKMLPMYMSKDDRTAVENGTRDPQDVVLDLESEKGRNACAKQYASLCVAIASKYRGRSGLDWNGLLSAAQMGLTKAMNDYHKPADYIDADTDVNPIDREVGKKKKAMSFANYAYWRIRNQILNDINEYSRTVKISQYQFDKNTASGNTKGNFNSVRPDLARIDDEGQTGWDRMSDLGTNDSSDRRYAEEWNVIYNVIDNSFSTRDASVFYMSLGLRGYKQQSNQEIAKILNLSGARITYILRGIFDKLKSNRQTAEAIDNIRELYNESLIANNYNCNKGELMEVLVNDDLYLMLNEMTRWNNKDVFNNAVGATLEDYDEKNKDFLMDCMYNDFTFIDENYHDHKKLYINFLEHLYPTECLKKKSDIDILNRMGEISDMFKKHNLSE